MPSPVPVVREVAWISVVPHLLVMGALIYASYELLTPDRLPESLAVGAAIYLLYSQGFRRLVTRRHRRGFQLLKQRAFSGAIAEYEKGYDFFSRHPWIDRFRYLTLLTSSAYSYREIALCSIAFAYAQMGDGAKAVETYERALAEFPDCAIARTSLKTVAALDGRHEEGAS
jgi:tetratricopeptide (TPR) repeat protein